MASIRIGWRCHALALGLLLAIVVSGLPRYAAAHGQALGGPPRLADFIRTVRNRDAAAVRGVYVEGLFALPVVQQPHSDTAFVSTQPGTLTQFGLAAGHHTFGFLAHNYLSGKYYFQLAPGHEIVLVYGDGRLAHFRVTGIERYQAMAPTNPYSDFRNLATQETVSSSHLFNAIYKRPGQVILQTCIESHGNPSWGRLFVIAEPEPEPAPSVPSN